ncbi:MAG: lipopolysaccharide biosynthesis protein [bacterium]|nr:lipopolysaccharide biosynthesis protein [bacterium]
MLEEHTAGEISVRRRVRFAATWLAGTRLLGQLLTLGMTVLITRLLQPADFGLYGMANLVISFLTLFEGVGLDAAIIQKQNLAVEDADRSFWLMLLINLGLYGITFALSPLLAWFFRERQLSGMIRILGLNLILVALYGVPYNLMTRELAFDQRSKAELVSGVGHSLICLIMVLAGWGVWALVYSSLATPLIMLGLIYYYQPWIPRLCSPFSGESRGLLNFGSQIMLSRLLWYAYSNSDFLIAGRLLGKEALGYYTLAFEMASLPLEKVVSMIPQIAYPTFAQVQHEEERVRHYFLKTCRLVALIVFPLFLGLFLVAEDLIRLVLTGKWAAAIGPLKILCLMSILRSLAVLGAPLTNALGRPNIALLNSLLCALILPPTFWVGARFGIQGISLAWLIAYPFLFLIITSNSIHTIRITLREYWLNLLPVIEASLFMLLVIFGLQSLFWSALTLWFRLFLTCFLGAVCYVGILWLANRSLLEELLEFIRRD